MTVAIVLSCVFFLPQMVSAENQEAKQLFSRSQFEFGDDRYQEALNFIDQAIKLDQVNLNYQHFRGTILARLKRYNEAIQVLRSVMAKDPVGQQAIIIELANVYAAMKDGANAEIHYIKAIQLFPNRPDLYLSRGLVYLSMNQYDRSEADFRHVAKADPKLAAFALYHLALVSYKKDDFGQAKERLEQAVALQPEKSLLQNCQQFLANIKAEEKMRKPFRFVTTVKLQYDDNVSNQPLESAAGLLPSGLPAQDQSDWSIGGSFLGVFNLVNTRKTQLGLSYNFLADYYEHLDENNLLAHAITLFYYRHAEPMYFRLSGGYNYYYADNEEKLALYNLNPGLTWAPNNYDRLDFLLNLQYRDMLDGTSDVNHYIGTLTYYHDFKIDKGETITFRAGLQVEYDDPLNDTAPDYNLYEFQTGATFPGLFGFVPDLGVKYELVRYDLFTAFDPTVERKDYRWELSIRVTKRITSNLQFMFLWTRTDSKSNIKTASNVDPYKFNRNVLTFLVSGAF